MAFAGMIVAAPTLAAATEGDNARLVRSTSGSRGAPKGNRYIVEDPRTVFSAGADRQVVVYFEWEGRAGNHRCEGRWKDPSGKVVLSAPVEYQAASPRFGIYWTLALPEGVTLGLWVLEAFVDGQPAGTHAFEIRADATSAPARARLSAADLYQRALGAVGALEALGSAGEPIARAAAVAVDQDRVWTTLRSVETASAIRLRTTKGRTETTEISDWSRREGWATVPFPGHGLAPLTRAERPIAVGDSCFVLDLADDGSWLISSTNVVGREQAAPARLRLESVFSAGSPVLDEFGDLVGMLVGPEEELGPLAVSVLGAVMVQRSILFVPPNQLGDGSARFPLAELASKGVFLRPLSAGQRHVISGVFAARVQRGGPVPMPLDQRFVFSRTEGQVHAFVQWSPEVKKDGLSWFELYDADNRVIVKADPVKVKMRPGELLFSTWTFRIAGLPPAVYRADLLLDEAPIWRGYVRISE